MERRQFTALLLGALGAIALRLPEPPEPLVAPSISYPGFATEWQAALYKAWAEDYRQEYLRLCGAV